MSELHPLDALVGGEPVAHAHRASRRRRRRKRRGRRLLVLLVALVVVGGAVFASMTFIKPIYDSVTASKDYKGSGTGTVKVQIQPGQSGRSIGQTLEQDGVVKTAGAFASAVSGNPDAAEHPARHLPAALQDERLERARAAARPVVPDHRAGDGPRGSARERHHRLAGQADRPAAERLPGGAEEPAGDRPPGVGARQGRGSALARDVHVRAENHCGQPALDHDRRGDQAADQGERAGRAGPEGAHDRLDRPGRGASQGGRAQGRAGAGQPAGDRHEAAAGLDRQLRHRQARSGDHGGRPGQPVAVQHLQPRGTAAGPDQQPGPGRDHRRAAPGRRLAGSTSSPSTRRPGRRSSRPPAPRRPPTRPSSTPGARRTRRPAGAPASHGARTAGRTCPGRRRDGLTYRALPLARPASRGVRRSRADLLDLRRDGGRRGRPAGRAGPARARNGWVCP